jgi:hypothetical protein
MSAFRDQTKEVDASSLSRKYRKGIRKAPKLPLSRTHPEIAAQWHPKKNKSLSPDELTYGSHTKIWWQCPVHQSHQWEAPPHSRCGANGEHRSGCPYCSGNKVCVTNSLATLFPHIAKEWHPRKNKNLTPATVTAHSNHKIWWQCQNDTTHVWQAVIGWRTHDNTGCPFCSNKKISRTNSLAAVFPKLAAQWHPSKNGNLTAHDIVPGSHQMVWWQCQKDSLHQWRTTPKSRVADKTGCPFCTGRKITRANNLAAAYPELAKEWHPTKNGNLTPDSVLPGTHTPAWWRCSKNKSHVWETKVVTRTRIGSGCPVCASNNKGKARKPVSAEYNFAKLFPKLVRQWHPNLNGETKPRTLAPNSNKIVWWQCEKGSDHVWSTKLVDRTKAKQGCPFCSNRRISTTNSLANVRPDIAAQWHPTKNGKLKASQVTGSTKLLAWWQCLNNKRHAWQATVQRRTGRGQNCPQCRVKP